MTYQQSFKKLTGRTTVFFMAAAFALISTAAHAADKANFSGEWTLNEEKSELGQFRMAAKKLKLDQQADALSIERLISFNGEERTVTEKLTLDGKENENTVFGTAKKKSTAKWSDDSQTLTVTSLIVFDRNGEKMEIKSTETWKLADNGQSLSVETNATSTMGTNTTKAIYNKAAK